MQLCRFPLGGHQVLHVILQFKDSKGGLGRSYCCFPFRDISVDFIILIDSLGPIRTCGEQVRIGWLKSWRIVSAGLNRKRTRARMQSLPVSGFPENGKQRSNCSCLMAQYFISGNSIGSHHFSSGSRQGWPGKSLSSTGLGHLVNALRTRTYCHLWGITPRCNSEHSY